ncbi:MAG: hypothetical protein AAGF71_12935, partial [Pseudomonadota bacterium]
VNIGNRVDIDRGDNTIGWRPEDGRRDDARDKIASKRGEDGSTTLPIDRGPSRGDDLRASLSEATGARDISAGAAAAAGAAAGAGAGALANVNRPSKVGDAQKREALAKTGRVGDGAAAKPQIKKPAAAAKPAIQKPAVKAPSALKKAKPAKKAVSAGNRGKVSGAKHKVKLKR